MLVTGDREGASGQVAVRHRKHGDLGVKTVEEFIGIAKALVDSKATTE
jgi:threonyl-tRNA synthetase